MFKNRLLIIVSVVSVVLFPIVAYVSFGIAKAQSSIQSRNLILQEYHNMFLAQEGVRESEICSFNTKTRICTNICLKIARWECDKELFGDSGFKKFLVFSFTDIKNKTPDFITCHKQKSSALCHAVKNLQHEPSGRYTWTYK